MYKAAPIVLEVAVKAELERRVRAAKTTQRDARRARIILLAAEGMSSAKIAKTVGISQEYVAVWRRRFLAKGLAGLQGDPRSGRPETYGHDDRIRLAALATMARDPADPEPTWTYQALADASGTGISASQVGRILNEMDIKPHQVRGWLNRRDDPEFWDRVQDVCGLYLSPPENALVISIDEKTSIQAKERRAATTPAAPGRPARQEFEYVRHGTASLLAALEVHSGEIFATDIKANDSVTFIDFLERLDHQVAAGLGIHLVLDNGSSHVSKATRAWLADHPRFVAHHTPVHASWVNQVELFFSIITRKVLRRGSFSSREDLVTKLMAYIERYNQTAKPFAWTYSGQPLKVAS